MRYPWLNKTSSAGLGDRHRAVVAWRYYHAPRRPIPPVMSGSDSQQRKATVAKNNAYSYHKCPLLTCNMTSSYQQQSAASIFVGQRKFSRRPERLRHHHTKCRPLQHMPDRRTAAQAKRLATCLRPRMIWEFVGTTSSSAWKYQQRQTRKHSVLNQRMIRRSTNTRRELASSSEIRSQ